MPATDRPASGIPQTRKHTRFELCQTHSGLGSSGRYRLAEIFCEGGPGSGPACAPRLCRIWPGRDLFAETATDEVAAEWVRTWEVNR